MNSYSVDAVVHRIQGLLTPKNCFRRKKINSESDGPGSL
jgi:hypothetical protein